MTLAEAEALAEARLGAADWPGAAEVYRAILEAAPGHPPALAGLGVSLCQAGSYREGAPLLREAALARPLDAEAQNNAGNALRVIGALDEAEGLLRRSLALDPSSASAWANLSALQRDRGAFAAALASADEALKRAPAFAPARLNRGTALQSLGRLEEAVEELKRAVEAAPRFLPAWNALLLFVQYSELHDAAAIADWTGRFGRLFPAPPRRPAPPEVRRIGWVGGDFREHPVGRCLDSFARELSELGLESVLYACQPDEDADAATARIAEAGEWRSLWGLSDEEARLRIEADRIDLLIDLAGHTARNRLTLFAGRAAPLQASWLGFSGSTGLPAMDFLIADPVVAPLSDQHLYAEKLVHLPLYIPPPWGGFRAAERGDGPCVFGCFNNPAKLGDSCLAAWGEILGAAPGSRLILKYGSLGQDAARTALEERLAGQGVPLAQVEIRGFRPAAEARLDYDDIDLALDAWPYSGALTTIDALASGVPVLTCPSDRYAGRQSASILAACGLEECVFSSREEWVAGAVRLASDPGLRQGLRARLATAMQSPPGEPRSFAAAFSELAAGLPAMSR